MASADGQNSVPLAFKEFKYLNSHSINFDVQIAICRLELPADIIVNSDMVPKELFITTHILSNQMAMHDVSMSTHYGVADSFHNSLIWDTVLNFPVKFRDLCMNSMLVFTAWTPQGKPFGGTSMRMFDEVGALKRGKQKLIFYFDRRGDSHIQSETMGELYEHYAAFDDNFLKEKKLEQYRNSVASGRPGSDDVLLDWLDRLVLAQVQSSIAVARQHQQQDHDGAGIVLSPEIQDLHSYCCLVVDMPMFPHPVLFEERLYPSVTPHLPRVAEQMLSVGTGVRSAGGMGEKGEVFEFNLTGRPFSGQALRHIVDWDMDADSPCEDMYRRLAHDTIRGRGGADAALKPNLQEKERLDRILTTPGDHLRTEDKDLMYRFRYVLTENKMALSKFLLSVDWSSEVEVAELPVLLERWKRKAPIEVSEALKLLSGGKAFQSPIVRKYAVDVLKKASVEELQVLLLQLVQALRYEPSSSSPGEEVRGAEDDGGEVVGEYEFAGGNEERSSAVPSKASLSPLGCFLVERACTSTTLANYFYWYLKVETEDSNMGPMFQNVFRVFMHELKAAGEAGAMMERKLRSLNEYVNTISSCQRTAREEKGRKDQKEAAMRKLLAENGRQKLPYGLDEVPMPLDPAFAITGLDPSTIFLFKSAMYPAVIDFSVTEVKGADPLMEGEGSDDEDVSPHEHKSDQESAPKRHSCPEDSFIGESDEHDRHVAEVASTPAAVYKIIFKSGDDLRQDQLVMQLISLMDGLLKKVNLDLGLLTYGILATGPTDGIMEFVRGSTPISAVLSSYGNSILAYLQHHNPDPRGPYGVKAQAMDMFVRSCASSCVVTYILGIGDRHLDNVMLRTNGQLFHIDFGFIFGRDPKPLPPPFRFTRPMADAMGGEDSDHYKRFKSYCCQAYNWLRKSANLILNLLSLMVDAGIPDLSINQDAATVMKKVEEKFRLDLTDELAEVFFLSLINDSLTALAPRLMELAHQISVARR